MAFSSGAQVALVQNAGVANVMTVGLSPADSASSMLTACMVHGGLLVQRCDRSPPTSCTVSDFDRGAASPYPGALYFERTFTFMRAVSDCAFGRLRVTWAPHGPASS